jgi:hypothetical protein
MGRIYTTAADHDAVFRRDKDGHFDLIARDPLSSGPTAFSPTDAMSMSCWANGPGFRFSMMDRIAQTTLSGGAHGHHRAMTDRPATSHDMARAAGVSQSAVSWAFRPAGGWGLSALSITPDGADGCLGRGGAYVPARHPGMVRCAECAACLRRCHQASIAGLTMSLQPYWASHDD